MDTIIQRLFKNKGPHVRVPLIFWFLIMTFSLCFYHQMSVKWVCIHIRNSSGHTAQTRTNSKCLWMFAHEIATLYNLFD